MAERIAIFHRFTTPGAGAPRSRSFALSSTGCRMTTAPQQFIIGVDLGGTNIVAGAMTVDGSRHLAMRSIPTNAFVGDEAVAERIVAADRKSVV